MFCHLEGSRCGFICKVSNEGPICLQKPPRIHLPRLLLLLRGGWHDMKALLPWRPRAFGRSLKPLLWSQAQLWPMGSGISESCFWVIGLLESEKSVTQKPQRSPVDKESSTMIQSLSYSPHPEWGGRSGVNKDREHFLFSSGFPLVFELHSLRMFTSGHLLAPHQISTPTPGRICWLRWDRISVSPSQVRNTGSLHPASSQVLWAASYQALQWSGLLVRTSRAPSILVFLPYHTELNHQAWIQILASKAFQIVELNFSLTSLRFHRHESKTTTTLTCSQSSHQCQHTGHAQ